MHYTNDSVTIEFDGGIQLSRPWLAADPRRAQRVLRNHADERASCQCTPYGVPMHVVCRLGKYHLATMPGRGHHHALSCPSYLPDDDASGLKNYSPEALSRAAGRHKLSVKPASPGLPPFNHFTPSAALQFLWEFSGLNVCTPRTVEKRNYFFAANSLYKSLPLIRFNEQALRAYIPLAVDTPDQCRYAIGQATKLIHGTYANGICLAADRKTTLWVDEKQWALARLEAVFGEYSAPKCPDSTWVIGKLWRSPQSNLRLFDVGTLRVNSQFLPIDAKTAPLLQTLVDNKRRFFVCQSYDADYDASIPVAVVIDRDEPRNIYSADTV
jgi:hypothetical protein